MLLKLKTIWPMIQRCIFFYAHVSDFPDDINHPFVLFFSLKIRLILLILMKNFYDDLRPAVVQGAELFHGTLLATESWNIYLHMEFQHPNWNKAPKFFGEQRKNEECNHIYAQLGNI